MSETRTTATNYAKDRFVETSAWTDLILPILSGEGSSCGVGGARGAGKSWLLQHAAATAQDRASIGVYFISPSAYDPAAFLSNLSQALAQVIIDTYNPTESLSRSAQLRQILRLRAVWIAAAVVLIGLAGYVIPRVSKSGIRLPWTSITDFLFWAFIAVGMAVVAGTVSLFLWHQRPPRNPSVRLYLRALGMQKWLQYATSTKSVNELALEAGKGFVAKSKSSEEVALSERPVTELTLVREFRALAKEAVAVLRAPHRSAHWAQIDSSARLIIAIDELDKIASIDEIRQLLRAIKGILDVDGVTTFVSVSDEAVRHLGLSGLRGRDEISSSFTSMITTPPLTYDECREVLGLTADAGATYQGRHGSVTVGDSAVAALAALTGGNQRDMVRLLVDALRAVPDGTDVLTPQVCIQVAEQKELDDFSSGLLAETDISDTARTAAYEWLRDYKDWRQKPPRSWDFRIRRLMDARRPEWHDDDGWPLLIEEQPSNS